MRKTVTVYAIRGGKKVVGIAYLTQAAAEKSIRDDITGLSAGAHVEPILYDLPDGAFWTGDTISVELHRGSVEVDSIRRGGQWTGPHYGYADPWFVQLSTGLVEGCMRELGTDRHIQTMCLNVGQDAYPYRNARLVRAQNEDGAQ